MLGDGVFYIYLLITKINKKKSKSQENNICSALFIN